MTDVELQFNMRRWLLMQLVILEKLEDAMIAAGVLKPEKKTLIVRYKEKQETYKPE